MNPTQQQSGAVLIMSLVILLVMTILGVSGMNTSLLQERMAGNTQVTQVAFQAAEAALRDGEKDVANNITNQTSFKTTCTNGLCDTFNASADVWSDGTVDWSSTSTSSIGYGANTGSATLSGLSEQPRYIIQRLQVTEGSLKTGFSANKAGDWYQVTGVGKAGDGGSAEVMVQSVYRK